MSALGHDLKEFARDLALDTKEHVSREIAKATAPLRSEIDGLKAEITELKQREYQGVWDNSKAYARHAMVTRRGSVWCSLANENRSTPGESPNWRLAVRAGRDGNDLR